MSIRWKGPVPERENKRHKSGSEEHEACKAGQRAHYYRNADKYRAAANDRVNRKRTRNQQWLINHLHGRRCADCGADDIRVLSFDHTDPADKHANIADLVSRGAKLEHIEAEVKKCVVVCHNCHMLRTFKALGGSFRERMVPITDEEFKRLREELRC